MAQDEKIELVGVVSQVLHGGVFVVTLQEEGLEDRTVRARISGKMKLKSIRVIEGDLVRIQMSPEDINQGIITYRIK